jgi:hypothetical protein
MEFVSSAPRLVCLVANVVDALQTLDKQTGKSPKLPLPLVLQQQLDELLSWVDEAKAAVGGVGGSGGSDGAILTHSEGTIHAGKSRKEGRAEKKRRSRQRKQRQSKGDGDNGTLSASLVQRLGDAVTDGMLRSAPELHVGLSESLLLHRRHVQRRGDVQVGGVHTGVKCTAVPTSIVVPWASLPAELGE